MVDVWMQHPTEKFLTQPFFASLNRWNRGQNTGAMGQVMQMAYNVDTTVKMLDMAKLELGLISAWHGSMGELISNDEVAEFVKKSNGRLVGTGTVDITKPVEAVKEIHRCVEKLDFHAIRVLPWLWQKPPTDRLFYPVYATCAQLNIPLCLQVGHTGPLMPSEYGRPIPYIDQVAIDFPTLTIVGGHIGYPWTEEMIAVCTKHENVYIDTSAYTVKRYPQQLVDYMVSKSGRKKVLFGSNYPMIFPAKCLQDLDERIYNKLDKRDAAECKELFLKGNACRIFNLARKLKAVGKL
eukprot:TRINITY_DN3399_c0_g1_i1.p1 TRINITY_DN3399_c0_g1~~TRINITY_DN3399_c0_g1_i1.p1  ORF type:complete len:316 (+),score=52.44 TRINITY_DN3399_c0_g1_i1:69-950(+)